VRFRSRFCRCEGEPFNWNHESVAHSRQSLDELWPLGRIFQRLSQLLNRRIYSVLEIDVGIFWPERGANLLAGDDLASGSKEQAKDLRRLFLNRHAGAGGEELSAIQFENELIELSGER